MSAIPRPSPRPLPDSLLRPLRQVARRHRVAVIGKGTLQVLATSLAVWLLAVLVAGFLPKLPVLVRGLLSTVAWGTLVVSGGYFLRPAVRWRSWTEVARQVEGSQADRHELISSAVELSGTHDANYGGSSELIAHLVRQAETAARGVRPESVVSYRAVRRWVFIAGPVLLVWLVLFPLWPGQMIRGFRHVAAPWRDRVPASLVEVTVTPGDVLVPEGDPLHVAAELSGQAMSGDAPAPSLIVRHPSGQTSTTTMGRTGALAFRTAIDRLTTSVEYRVAAAGGTSAWYRATLQPRPAVAGTTVQYTYPKYTRLPPRSESRADGAIDAVVGTTVSLTLKSTQPLTGSSRIVVTENGSTPGPDASILLVRGNGNEYVAAFQPTVSGHYRIELTAANGLAGIDRSERSILVRPDSPPTIGITSPAAKITLPMDDTVPVRFRASDDFGLAKVEAIVQVDSQTPSVFEIRLPSREPRETAGAWQLSIPYLLARANDPDASRVVYQLRATDARSPDPQAVLTPRQVVEIDHSFKESLTARTEAESTRNLIEAIRQAIQELNKEAAALEPLARTAAERMPSAGEKRIAGVQKETIVKTGQALGAAAEANLDGPLDDTARAVKALVSGPIYGAADDVATTLVNASEPGIRRRTLRDATTKLESARTQLEALLKRAGEEAKTQALVRAVQDLAKHEEQVARALEQKRAAKISDRGREVQSQAEMRQRLDELLAKNQDLNSPPAREAAQRNQQLIQRVEQLEQDRGNLDPLPARQQAVNDARGKVDDFAKRQEALNQEIADFAKARQPQVKQAGARIPDAQGLANIVKALKDPNQVPRANAEQQQAANELAAAAQALENASKENAAVAERQRRDRQDAERADQAEKQAKEIAQLVAEAKVDEAAKKDANRARDLANQLKQREQQLAQQLEQQANPMKAGTPDRQKAVAAALDDIAAARREADQANGDLARAMNAAEKLSDAAEKLQTVATDDDAQAGEDRKALAVAAEKAQTLANEQKDLADAAGKAAQALAQARGQEGNPQALEQGEQQAARQAEQVAGEAAQAQQQDQAAAPELGERAAMAKAALKEAAAHERKAAAAAKGWDAATAAKEQRVAGKSLSAAELALRGLPEAVEAHAQDDAPRIDPNAADPNAAEMKEIEAGVAVDATTPASDAASGEKPAAAGLDPAPAKADAGTAASEPETAGEPTSPAAGDPIGEAAKRPSNSPARSNAAKSRSARAAPTPLSLVALREQAASHLQIARQAQDEAVNQQRPEAARQAAQALREAARALQQSLQPGSSQFPRGSNPGKTAAAQPDGREPSNAPAGDPVAADLTPATGREPGRSVNSRSANGQGINVAAVGRADSRPESIRQFGVSASDWAKLPPMTKQDLLNAAQQEGPPEYQEMIRNYFTKIAKLQAETK